jgi:hypothetical protein
MHGTWPVQAGINAWHMAGARRYECMYMAGARRETTASTKRTNAETPDKPDAKREMVATAGEHSTALREDCQLGQANQQ